MNWFNRIPNRRGKKKQGKEQKSEVSVDEQGESTKHETSHSTQPVNKTEKIPSTNIGATNAPKASAAPITPNVPYVPRVDSVQQPQSSSQEEMDAKGDYSGRGTKTGTTSAPVLNTERTAKPITPTDMKVPYGYDAKAYAQTYKQEATNSGNQGQFADTSKSKVYIGANDPWVQQSTPSPEDKTEPAKPIQTANPNVNFSNWNEVREGEHTMETPPAPDLNASYLPKEGAAPKEIDVNAPDPNEIQEVQLNQANGTQTAATTGASTGAGNGSTSVSPATSTASGSSTVSSNVVSATGTTGAANATTPNTGVAARTGNDPYGLDAAQKEIDAASKAKIESFRELLDRYKPESADDREKRERKEQMRRNIIGLMNMGAAVGNLASAASGRDGRSVNTPNLNEAANKAIETQRALRKERDAKYDDANMKLHEAMLNTANEKYANRFKAMQADQAYQMKMAEANRKAAKDLYDAEYKQALYDLKRKDADDNARYRAEKLVIERAKASAAAAKKKDKEGAGSHQISIDGGKKTLRLPKSVYSDKIFIQQIEDILPDEYHVHKVVTKNEESGAYVAEYVDADGNVIANPTTRQKQIGDIRYNQWGRERATAIYELIGDYANKAHSDDDKDWNLFVNVLTSSGAEFEDNKEYKSAAKKKTSKTGSGGGKKNSEGVPTTTDIKDPDLED